MKHRQKRKAKPWLIAIVSIVAVLILGIGGYAFYLFHSVNKTAAEVYKPLKQVKTDTLHTQKAIQPKKENPINILILGVDQRPGDSGRSDTLMVASLNPQTNSMMLTSIPRDTQVDIQGHGEAKINAAYAYGREDLAISTVEKYLNIPINYYVEMNMQGLSELVDAVGGIQVTNKLDWYDEGYYKKGYHYKKGLLTLNGPKALGYVRRRHLDPQGDFGRNERQRQVIQAVIEKEKSVFAIKDVSNILNAIGNNVQTNLTLSNMTEMAKAYLSCSQHIKTYEVKGTPQYIKGISWVIVTKNEFQHVHNMITKMTN
ncbi:LCP family protein [Pullulanibacillus sp. KACC 23026]|nr:LCP family protein [Pullulanibacillus sp. KACC 23026]WEG14886.1 LCP family protein [Pullulanibacillus sp. KACC 23026]